MRFVLTYNTIIVKAQLRESIDETFYFEAAVSEKDSKSFWIRIRFKSGFSNGHPYPLLSNFINFAKLSIYAVKSSNFRQKLLIVSPKGNEG